MKPFFQVIITVSICFMMFFGLKAQSQNFVSNTVRGSLMSDALGIEKSYQVFLPESYHYSDKSTYPVVYIVDGDYNALYMTGLIESYSNVSEKIPELIVVAISDHGNEAYQKDCGLQTPSNPTGNAHNFMKYIEEELKPEIDREFQTSSYEILIGHSLGGLFATTVFLEKQDAFDAYIAIDPSYWWDENYIVSHADSLFKKGLGVESQLYVSLASTQQMGVHEFIAVLENTHTGSPNWSFNYYPDEDHGSVGVVSVKDGLLRIFKDWKLTREKFYEFKSAQELMGFYKEKKQAYQSELRLPPLLFGNMLYYYVRSEKWDEVAVIEQEITTNFSVSSDDFYSKLASYYARVGKSKEAYEALNKSTSQNKHAYKSHDQRSKMFYTEKKFNEAEAEAKLALEIARGLKARQWQLNELEANLRKIRKEIGEE